MDLIDNTQARVEIEVTIVGLLPASDLFLFISGIGACVCLACR